jgi:beta-glucosidase
MPTGQYFGDALHAAVRAGAVPEARLDDMLIRRYRQMLRCGLFDRAPRTSPIPADAHAAIAREIGAAGTVLLRNQGGLLPLRAGAIRRLAVLGPWSTKAATGGGGSSMVNPVRQVTPREAIERRQVTELLTDDGVDPATAAGLARAADVAVVVVGDFESEGADRSSLSLPGGQDALIAAVAAANPRTVVVLHAGAPVLMPWRDQVAAILAGWYPGGVEGETTAAVLFGARAPAGRLPITFPASETDGPANTPRRYPGVGGTVWYEEGLLVGHRWYDATGAQPLFPFGFGLSYSTFAYSDLKAPEKIAAGEPLLVEARVANTGTREGDEVVQVYLTFPKLPGAPLRALRGFTRVHLKPGEQQTVRFTLKDRDLSQVSPDGVHLVRTGRYGISVGGGQPSTGAPAVAGAFDIQGERTLPR